MSRRLETLAKRKRALVVRAAAQREAVAIMVERWEKPLALVDTGIAAGRYLRAHPGIVVVAVALLVALRPRRVLSWTGRAIVLARMVQRVRTLLAPLLA